MSIQEIAQEIKSQDNACTAWPMFVVQQRRRLYGLDTQWSDDNVVWIDSANDNVEATPEEHDDLEAKYDVTGDEPDGWTRTAYIDQWEFVSVFFTRKAAESYITNQRHNLNDPRIYVESANRNVEWQTIERHLRGVAS